MDKVVIGDCTLFHGDCEGYIREMADVDAVVTDPPYGIGEAAGKNKSRGNLAKAKDYGDDEWDNQPPAAWVFDALRANSAHQIIFGGNYFPLPPAKCWLIWDKLNGDNDFADCEMAWTNLDKAVRRLQYRWNGMLRQNNEPRGDHPTQKPIGVMKWCLAQLPEEVTTIFDPYMGSGTTGVACAHLKKKFIGIERERKYFDAACRRLDEFYNPLKSFETKPAEQMELGA